jgi:hypothetical protein
VAKTQANGQEGHSICHKVIGREWTHNCVTGRTEIHILAYFKYQVVNNGSAPEKLKNWIVVLEHEKISKKIPEQDGELETSSI